MDTVDQDACFAFDSSVATINLFETPAFATIFYHEALVDIPLKRPDIGIKTPKFDDNGNIVPDPLNGQVPDFSKINLLNLCADYYAKNPDIRSSSSGTWTEQCQLAAEEGHFSVLEPLTYDKECCLRPRSSKPAAQNLEAEGN